MRELSQLHHKPHSAIKYIQSTSQLIRQLVNVILLHKYIQCCSDMNENRSAHFTQTHQERGKKKKEKKAYPYNLWLLIRASTTIRPCTPTLPLIFHLHLTSTTLPLMLHLNTDTVFGYK